jgi:hypothetical protein
MDCPSFESGFLATMAPQYLGEHVQHEQLEKVLGVEPVLVPEPELAGLLPHELEAVKMEKRTQSRAFESHLDSTDDADADELCTYICEVQ